MFTLVYTCPNCGADIEEHIIATYPPITKRFCRNCGWSYEEQSPKIIRTPFIVPSDYGITQTISYSPCTNCSVNPKNGGSGICHCTLNTIKIT